MMEKVNSNHMGGLTAHRSISFTVVEVLGLEVKSLRHENLNLLLKRKSRKQYFLQRCNVLHPAHLSMSWRAAPLHKRMLNW